MAILPVHTSSDFVATTGIHSDPVALNGMLRVNSNSTIKAIYTRGVCSRECVYLMKDRSGPQAT